MNTGDRYVGIDIAQAHLDIGVRPSGEVWQVSYDTPGVANLLVQLAELTPTLVVLEATGGLEAVLVGVAPFNRDSGTLRGKRKTRTG